MKVVPCRNKFVSNCALLIGVISIGIGLAFAQAPSSLHTPPAAESKRPANVPDGYVVTPFGYFHRSCVQSLAKGESLLADGRVQHADGTAEENAAICNYPRYTHDGLQVTADSKESSTLPEVNGWMENANISTGSASKSYGALVATWSVPPQPIAQDGQVLFYFPGLEDINNTQSILQPVLQWANGQWAIASWNCCLNDITVVSSQVNVNPGDEILGSITSNCRPGTVSCSTWNVMSMDLFTGESTSLNGTPSDGQVFNWAFGAVFEPYFVIACDDFPPNGKISFDNVIVFDEHMRPVVDPEWSGTFNSTQTPQCNYGVKMGPHEIKLDY